MFRDIWDFIKEFFLKIISSRLFILGAVCFVMFSTLVVKLFNLQIVNGEEALNEYMQITEKTITTAGTRGNIYDCKGKLLAYNELAYSVTIQDIGAYNSAAERNAMYLRLVRILEKHGETVQGKFEIALDSNGDMVYTSSSEAARKRFLRDYYGLKSVDELDKDEKTSSKVSARELFEIVCKNNELDKLTDSQGNPVAMTDQEALDIINIKYALRLMSYRKYETTTIASQVSDETVADILEHMDELPGVGVETTTIRAYNNSVSLAPVIGYTSKVSEEQLEELKKTRDDYDANDIVGTAGIEATMENALQGTKGSKTIYKDSMGSVREVKDETEPSAGSDVYLTLDADLVNGIYHLIEQSLAGVLINKLMPGEEEESVTTDGSSMRIPVKDAYYQLINNNILSLREMESEDASETEKNIYHKYLSSKEQIFAEIRNELLSGHPTAMKDLPQDQMSYMFFIYTYLADSRTVGIIQEDLIDTNSEEYKAWKADEISLRDYLYYGIASGWVDTTKFQKESKYSSADDTFQALVDYVLGELADNRNFTKRIYRFLINDDIITGQELCLALFEQGVLEYNEQDIQELRATGDAYSFLIRKISTLELTPAQLALSPCNAAVVVTDVKTGKVKALVSYPGYDNNKIGDNTYFSQLQTDMSLPLYNNATQTSKAPGSTFKPITAVAALEEHVITPEDTITCTGLYTDVDTPIKCWIYSGHHGPLTMAQGIQNSCNFFFNELGHRLSMDEEGNYSTDRGLDLIRKYASLFGLDRKSGIELAEQEPKISKEDPERSAMGQGSHAYTNVQLSRYTAAIANRGDVFELSLLDKVTDSEGNLIQDYAPEISSHIDAAATTWDTVQQGMRSVIADSTTKKLFTDLEVPVAGKTGTSQEAKNKPNHAFFISYAPYDNPEICVTVNIPYGYSSSNAATIAKNVYKYYYGYIDLDSILNAGARSAANVNIRD